MKTCRDCQQEKALSQFNKCSGGSQGAASYCKACDKARAKAWYHGNKNRARQRKRAWEAENREHLRVKGREFYHRHKERLKLKVDKVAVRNRKLSYHYGINLQDYNLLLEKQGNACAICGGPPGGRGSKSKHGFHVDHCHATGKIRGLLCSHCNTGLGKFKDSPDLLQRAAAYLSLEFQSEIARLQRLNESLVARIAAQSELLSRRAEKNGDA